eukprot:4304838-Alexandrium_andersonii.AAC.1
MQSLPAWPLGTLGRTSARPTTTRGLSLASDAQFPRSSLPLSLTGSTGTTEAVQGSCHQLRHASPAK